ncbi:hypothetical protein [Aeromonas allosaccharophila]|uniref:hypothetical protein n=1 Tax=Aeromonas allosaccharophila TaxID=656 RepID=UPI00111B1B2B|nr:hypothetical protein [Aeromonas allosaccharophila]
METPLRKLKNFNKIELLAKKPGLLGNTSSWLVLQSFHPPMAGFFLFATADLADILTIVTNNRMASYPLPHTKMGLKLIQQEIYTKVTQTRHFADTGA